MGEKGRHGLGTLRASARRGLTPSALDSIVIKQYLKRININNTKT